MDGGHQESIAKGGYKVKAVFGRDVVERFGSRRGRCTTTKKLGCWRRAAHRRGTSLLYRGHRCKA